MFMSHLSARRGLGLLASIASLFAFSAASNRAMQQDQTAMIDVDDPRPLASAVEVLEKRYGWVITYEDPPYLNASEISDVTLAVSRNYNPRKPPVLVPRGGPFRVLYTVQANTREPDEATLLQTVLDEYHQSGNAGVFRLLRTGSVFHVVPVESKSAQGTLEPRRSILDASISLPAGEKTADQMINAIAAAVSRPDARVTMGTIPTNLLMQTPARAAAINESARLVLLQTLAATNRKLSWRLLCGPGAIHTCALNIHVVDDVSRQ